MYNSRGAYTHARNDDENKEEKGKIRSDSFKNDKSRRNTVSKNISFSREQAFTL